MVRSCPERTAGRCGSLCICGPRAVRRSAGWEVDVREDEDPNDEGLDDEDRVGEEPDDEVRGSAAAPGLASDSGSFNASSSNSQSGMALRPRGGTEPLSSDM